ncbi:rho GTPase-activating protein REN1-like [Wolffia australiana]
METQQHLNETATHCKFCRDEGDTNFWGPKNSESHDKHLGGCHHCQVFKSGHLLISSKGIGWTSWKRRWFILTRTSLVFFRSDPNIPSPKGETNLTLGGIDLNNSGRVVAKADKKLLTVLFPDGRDGRAFTLKAESLEDLNEWKSALDSALTQAPSAALLKGPTGIFQNDAVEVVDASFEQWQEKKTMKSMIIGQPILLALEDINGSPSFLEKAIRFIEKYGIKVEGILRQSADVEEVEHRVQEFEKGKNEFDLNEDAHVIGDCIKYFLRELPSSPVPVSCCTALLEALRSDRGSRTVSMRSAVCDLLPEPNRRLMQRILRMMRVVASHRSENRMTISALAACMAPLLLRALLAGDCELEDGINIGDGSLQLLKAAAAANHAQAIIIIMLEEYERIFDDNALSSGLCSDSDGSNGEDGNEDGDEDDVENEDDDDYDDDDDDNDDDGNDDVDNDDDDDDDDGDDGNDDDDDNDDDDGDAVDVDERTDGEVMEDEGYHDAQNDLAHSAEEDSENLSAGTLNDDIELCGCKEIVDHASLEETPKLSNDNQDIEKSGQSLDTSPSEENFVISQEDNHGDGLDCMRTVPSPLQTSLSSINPLFVEKLPEKSNNSILQGWKLRPPTKWGRTSARKNLSMESIDYSVEDDNLIQRLEITKSDLEAKIAKEVQANAILQGSIEKRKETLHERRAALEEDVKGLQEQLRREKERRLCLEAGLMNLRPGHVSFSTHIDCRNVRSDLEDIALSEKDVINLKQKIADLRGQFFQPAQQMCPTCGQHIADPSKWVNTLTTSPSHHLTNTVEEKGAAKSHPVDLSEELTKEKVKGRDDEKSKTSQPARKAHSKIESSESPEAASGLSLLSSSSSTSTFSRLTHRLNFLKERRIQLANELQSIDQVPAQSPESTPSQGNFIR